MPFEILDTFSLPGDPLKPNDDAFGHADNAAVVIDGATSLGEPLMPGDSDAAWIAHFGARRLIAHVQGGDAPQDALRHTLADAKKSFEALRRRAPEGKWEMPFASMAFAFEASEGFDFLWFGDCAGLLHRAPDAVETLGESLAAKQREAQNVAKLAKASGLSPVGTGGNRPEFLPALRQARERLNTVGKWVFSPDPEAAEHVGQRRVAAPKGSILLLASDGFPGAGHRLRSPHTAHTLMHKAIAKGLGILADELREIEDADPQGHKHPRFKKSDDANRGAAEAGVIGRRLFAFFVWGSPPTKNSSLPGLSGRPIFREHENWVARMKRAMTEGVEFYLFPASSVACAIAANGQHQRRHRIDHQRSRDGAEKILGADGRATTGARLSGGGAGCKARAAPSPRASRTSRPAAPPLPRRAAPPSARPSPPRSGAVRHAPPCRPGCSPRRRCSRS